MSESKIQTKLIKSLEAQGYYVIKLSVTNKPGIPDILAIPPGSNVEFYEVKQPGKKPRPLQEYRIKEINDNGFGTARIYDGSLHNRHGGEDDSHR